MLKDLWKDEGNRKEQRAEPSSLQKTGATPRQGAQRKMVFISQDLLANENHDYAGGRKKVDSVTSMTP